MASIARLWLTFAWAIVVPGIVRAAELPGADATNPAAGLAPAADTAASAANTAASAANTAEQVANTAEQAANTAEQARLDFFEAKVRPLLAGHCYNCHSANTNSQGGLRVDDRNGLLTGGGRGAAIVPGDAEASLLIQAVRRTHEKLKMPPEHPLADDQVADLVRWIAEGAVWPAEQFALSPDDVPAEYAALREQHWAWQPLARPAAPDVVDQAWPRGPIDRFILSRLEAAGLPSAADADPRTLVRRLTFDLAGRPPTPQEVAAFLHASPSTEVGEASAAVASLVDRLLASPEFGERWGRHWLDVARYGESTGGSRNVPYPHAWRYRDWIIDAFNADMPYDQFLRQQIAGDLLPADSPRQRDQQVVATGFLALGVCDVNQRFKVRFVMDNIDEQIDAVSRAVLGLTVSCARCHDHKFDPIPTADYYALAGIFHGSDRCAAVRNKMGGGGMDYYDTAMLLRLGPNEADPTLPTRIEQAQGALATARAQLQALQQGAAAPAATDAGETAQPPSEEERKQQLDATRQQIASLQEDLFNLNDPAFHGPVALGMRDAATVGDTHIRIRGEAERLGPTVPRGFLSAVPVPDAPTIEPGGSGRRELALWLTSRHNPLTPRVMANRVWQRMMGQGLVRTVDNFGVTGDRPSHPELLDHLAGCFIDEGWSVKRLVRAIALSRAYQLSSQASPAHLLADPECRLAWRHRPRRLDAEEIRDAMLATSGRLDRNRPAGSPVAGMRVRELGDLSQEARQLAAHAVVSPHRSVYLPLLRGLTPQSLAVFDFAEQGMVTGSRATTTVAPQALYLLNDPFVIEQSRALAGRLLSASELNAGDSDDEDRIDLAHQLAFARPATKHELLRGLDFLADYQSALMAAAGEPTDQAASESDPRFAAWTSYCQAILASAEFRYLR
jgi:hypothetical protein